MHLNPSLDPPPTSGPLSERGVFSCPSILAVATHTVYTARNHAEMLHFRGKEPRYQPRRRTQHEDGHLSQKRSLFGKAYSRAVQCNSAKHNYGIITSHRKRHRQKEVSLPQLHKVIVSTFFVSRRSRHHLKACHHHRQSLPREAEHGGHERVLLVLLGRYSDDLSTETRKRY